MNGPFAQLEPDWKDRVRNASSKLTEARVPNVTRPSSMLLSRQASRTKMSKSKNRPLCSDPFAFAEVPSEKKD
jgi:hypothetical protein